MVLKFDNLRLLHELPRASALRHHLGARAAVSIGTPPADRRGSRIYGASVRARAPLRLGLAGGGTDLSPYCDEFGGAILNATIGRYAYAHLSFRDDHRVCFSAHDVKQDDIVPLAAELPLDSGLLLHRAVFNRMTRDFLRGALPCRQRLDGSGCAAGVGPRPSSALVVALVKPTGLRSACRSAATMWRTSPTRSSASTSAWPAGGRTSMPPPSAA